MLRWSRAVYSLAPHCTEGIKYSVSPQPHTLTLSTQWLPISIPSTRWLHTTTCTLDKKATVEKAVETVKEKKKKVSMSDPVPPDIKLSLARRLWDAVLHYYHGFRLLALDIRVAFRLFRKTVRSQALTRREQKQVLIDYNFLSYTHTLSNAVSSDSGRYISSGAIFCICGHPIYGVSTACVRVVVPQCSPLYLPECLL